MHITAMQIARGGERDCTFIVGILYAQLIKHTQCWQIAIDIPHVAHLQRICRFVHII